MSEKKKGKKEKPDDSLEAYTSSAIRGPEKSVRAMILAEHLVLSVTSTPLKAILHIAQAASMFGEEDLKKLEIDALDIDVLLTMSLTIDEAAQFSQYNDPKPDTYQIIAHYIDFEKYFRPWIISPFFPHRVMNKTKEYTEAIKLANEGEVSCDAVWYSLQTLMPAGYKQLKNEFCRWGTPKAQRMAERISSQIDSGTYADVMKMLQKPVEGTR